MKGWLRQEKFGILPSEVNFPTDLVVGCPVPEVSTGWP